MLEEIDTVKIPVWAITYLEYGESDNLSDHEENLIKDFLSGYSDHKGLVFDYRGEAYFSPNNALDGLGHDVIDVTIYGYPVEGLTYPDRRNQILSATRGAP
jgi:hypothetical protein